MSKGYFRCDNVKCDYDICRECGVEAGLSIDSPRKNGEIQCAPAPKTTCPLGHSLQLMKKAFARRKKDTGEVIKTLSLYCNGC